MAPTTRTAVLVTAGITAVAAGACALPAAAQLPPVGPPPPGPPPPEPPAPPPSSGRLKAPRVVATGTSILLRGSEATPRARVAIQIRRKARWRRIATRRADRRGRYRLRVKPRRARRYRLRARVAGGRPSRPVRVRARHVTLDAVGDINLGDGVATTMYQLGYRYPWSGVARRLRSADVAFGNLECAVSKRGSAIPGKQYTFRGRPAALRAAARYAGMDVLNLANNHAGDFGPAALTDTLAWIRRFGMTSVGAGRDLDAARRLRVVERLGLRIAFVGFSDINPAGFGAGPSNPGTVFATP